MAKIQAEYLADTSAWFWAAATEATWLDLVSDGQVATCPIIELEYLYSAPSSQSYEQWKKERTALECVPLDRAVGIRAQETQRLLAKRQELGHRSVKLADLLIAACAEQANLKVLHYDQDYDLISGVTGQQCEWLAPRGSLSR